MTILDVFKDKQRKKYRMEEIEGFKYIKSTREYLDYLEEHLNNVGKAFIEVSDACDGMVWVGDDYSWHTLRAEVLNHDISKFSKEEFTQYRNKFFPVKREQEHDADFNLALNHHKLNNTHHHESIRTDCHGNIEKDIVHMVIDWTAMGYKFGDTAERYYLKNKDTIKIPKGYESFLEEIFHRLRK